MLNRKSEEKRPAMMKIIQKEKLSNQVYNLLKEMIIDHRFQPGSRLNVEQLAREMGVSRTPVWEAVGRLEQEGLLENIPNRGVFMATLTPEIAFELYQVREELESLAATLAAPRIETAALDEMEKCLELQRQVIEKEDLVAYSRLDFEFHAAVYLASGNHVLQELLEAIKNKMRPLSLQVQPLLSRFYQDHQNILQALKKHDPAAAAAAFRRHNSKMKELMRSEMKPRNDEDSQEPGKRIAENQRAK
jgi:DNA-binding GntR family transcriptional regulator